VIGAAIRVAKIATGEIEDTPPPSPSRAKAGKAGGQARATKLTQAQRHEAAKKAAATRWAKNSHKPQN
jgi:hypothetical protein